MARRTALQRAETFGFEGPHPWALSAFQLLFHVPRAYRPLTNAWNAAHPGTARALNRLVGAGFVAHQPRVIIDTVTTDTASKESRKVPRYIATEKGRRLARAIVEDPRSLEDTFTRVTVENATLVARLVDALALSRAESRFGISASHAIGLSGLGSRTGQWWIKHLVATGHARVLDEKIADVRELIPEHWRVTRLLCLQLREVLRSLPPSSPHAALIKEFRLGRARFLEDIDVERVGLTGSTDYDHDVEAQRVLAALLASPSCNADGVFQVEPRLRLPVVVDVEPWVFEPSSSDTVPHQPDAIITERVARLDGPSLTRVNLIEYERHQTRRDAWSHIERFLGYLHLFTVPSEEAVLRFVVDSKAREETYADLIGAFADYALDHPERVPANRTFLAVADRHRLVDADDALDLKSWHRLELPQPEEPTEVRRPVLHPKDESPYDAYFSLNAQ